MLEWIGYSLFIVIFIAWVFMTVTSHDTHALFLPLRQDEGKFP